MFWATVPPGDDSCGLDLCVLIHPWLPITAQKGSTRWVKKTSSFVEKDNCDNHEYLFNTCSYGEENLLCCSTWWLPAMGHLKKSDCHRRSKLLILFNCQEQTLKQLCISSVAATVQENSPEHCYRSCLAHFWLQISFLIKIFDTLLY